MGNETSILEQCTIDESPILKSKYWSLHHGQRDEDHAQLSVFVSKQKRVTNDDNILFQSAKVYWWHDLLKIMYQDILYKQMKIKSIDKAWFGFQSEPIRLLHPSLNLVNHIDEQGSSAILL